MSVEAVGRALSAPLGGNPKVILLGLANHAHPDGTNAYPTVETLRTYANCARSTVQRNLRELEAAGWIEQEGVGPLGQTRWRVNLGGPQNRAGGPHQRQGGAAPMRPEPSIEPSEGSGSARAREATLPEGFPDNLLPHLRHVYRVLRDLARRHAAKEPAPYSLALIVMARPRHELVKSAHDFAAWADDQPTKRRDVLSGYRNWLGKTSALAVTEPMPGEEPESQPSNVTPLRQKDSRPEVVKRGDAVIAQMLRDRGVKA